MPESKAHLCAVAAKQQPAVPAVVPADQKVELKATRLTELGRLVLSPVWARLGDLLLLAHCRRMARHRV